MILQHPELAPETIVRFIEQHYREPLTPRDVAAELHYSLCHVTHVARRTLGASVGELIFRRRLESARYLLERTPMPIASIAAQSGFGDVAYFSRRFSHAMGASPSRWRKLHRAVENRGGCRACGGVLPLVAFAQDDAAEVGVAAS
jgi:AraC-like DNA-binding protein